MRQSPRKRLENLLESKNEAELQGSFEFYKDAFSSTLRAVEKSMANALKFVDHPKAKGCRREAVLRQQFGGRGDEVASTF